MPRGIKGTKRFVCMAMPRKKEGEVFDEREVFYIVIWGRDELDAKHIANLCFEGWLKKPRYEKGPWLDRSTVVALRCPSSQRKRSLIRSFFAGYLKGRWVCRPRTT